MVWKTWESTRENYNSFHKWIQWSTIVWFRCCFPGHSHDRSEIREVTGQLTRSEVISEGASSETPDDLICLLTLLKMDDFTIQNDSNMKLVQNPFDDHYSFQRNFCSFFCFSGAFVMQLWPVDIFWGLKSAVITRNRYEFFRTQPTDWRMRKSLPNHMGLFQLWRVKSPKKCQPHWEHLFEEGPTTSKT